MAYSIAIIGGGAAGISTLVQLINKLIDTKETNVRLLLIEKKKIGYGLAYGTNEKAHIINLTAGNMSPIQEDPSHFVFWLNKNKEKWQSIFPNENFEQDSFPPRLLFGIYLEDIAKMAIEKAKKAGIKVQIIKDEAIDITLYSPNKFTVSFTENVDIVVDQVIMAIGHINSTEYREFLSYSNYYQSPWAQDNSMAAIPKTSPVTILGTRLTGIDAVLSLVENGHKGPLTMVSRGGLLPCVIGRTKPYIPKFLNLEKIYNLTGYNTRQLKLKELVELFWQEIEAAEDKSFDRKEIFDKKLSAIEWLKNEIQVAESSFRPWQSVLAAIYPIVPALWSALDKVSQKEFLDKYYSLWITYLAAFPLQNAKKILELLTSGQLKVIGELQSIKFDEETKQFEVLTTEEAFFAPYLINATGPGHDITKSDSILLKNLLNKGMIKPHPLGGIDVDFKKLQVIDKDNNKVKRLFVIGDQTWGVCMATADLSQVGREAHRITNLTLVEIASYNNQLTQQPVAQSSNLVNQVKYLTDEQQQIKQFLNSVNQSLLRIQPQSNYNTTVHSYSSLSSHGPYHQQESKPVVELPQLSQTI